MFICIVPPIGRAFALGVLSTSPAFGDPLIGELMSILEPEAAAGACWDSGGGDDWKSKGDEEGTPASLSRLEALGVVCEAFCACWPPFAVEEGLL